MVSIPYRITKNGEAPLLRPLPQSVSIPHRITKNPTDTRPASVVVYGFNSLQDN